MRKLMIAAALLLFATATASAQVRKGLTEYNANGHFTVFSDNGESTTVFQLQGRIGKFLSNAIEVGPSLSLIKVEDVDAVGAIGAFLHAHFGSPGARSVPYVGAELAVALNDDDCFDISCRTVIGAVGGGKFFVGPSGAFTVEAFVSNLEVRDNDITIFGVRLGMSLFH